MDIQKIEQLISLIEKSSINEVEVKENESSVRITRSQLQSTCTLLPHQTIHYMPTPSTAQQQTHSEPTQKTTSAIEKKEILTEGEQVKSPMVGTFYQSPFPGANSFVSEGQKVKVGDTLCIIEAMKIMNQIESEYSGTILKILVKDRSPVEYDQPLFIIR